MPPLRLSCPGGPCLQPVNLCWTGVEVAIFVLVHSSETEFPTLGSGRVVSSLGHLALGLVRFVVGLGHLSFGFSPGVDGVMFLQGVG